MMKTEVGQINSEVVNALLESFYDVLDRDGKRSILHFANLEQDLMDKKLPPGTFPYSEFLKIIQSMKQLMAYSSSVMKELGRKFAIYLNPIGTNFQGFIQMLNNYFGDYHFVLRVDEISDSEGKIFRIALDDCPFLDHDGYYDGMCDFFEGMFSEGLRKSMGGVIKYDRDFCNGEDTKRCEFRISWMQSEPGSNQQTGSEAEFRYEPEP